MRRVLAALVAVVAVLVPATPAWAHARLVASDPAPGSTVVSAPAVVTLRFSERLSPDFTTIVVSDAARRQVPGPAPAIDDIHCTLHFAQPLGNGAYTVAYRVVSVDGHTAQGSYAFVVADPARPAASTVASTAAASTAAPGDSGGVPAGVLIGLGVAGVILAALAAYLYLSGRRRSSAPGLNRKVFR